MLSISRSFVLLAVASFALTCSWPTLAFIIPCATVAGTDVQPAHAQSSDSLTFSISVVANTQDVAFERTTTDVNVFGRQIYFDVLVAPESAGPFPGYQQYTINAGSLLPAITGTFGPLPVGQYTVTTTVQILDSAALASCPIATRVTKQSEFTVYADDGLAPVIEYYWAARDHYFLTQFPEEIAALDSGIFPGWVRTGQSFLAGRPGQEVGQPVIRWYGLPSAGLDTHFFAFHASADAFALTAGPWAASWMQESDDAFDLDFPLIFEDRCPPGETPVYRLWNQRVDTNHRYTTDPAIKAQMIGQGWVPEGYGADDITMCAFTRPAM